MSLLKIFGLVNENLLEKNSVFAFSIITSSIISKTAILDADTAIVKKSIKKRIFKLSMF